jgi:Sigma-70 region 2
MEPTHSTHVSGPTSFGNERPQYRVPASVFTYMKASRTLDTDLYMADTDRSVTDAIAREQPRLKAWLRRQVPDPQDIEDILQDAFYEFVVAARLIEPIGADCRRHPPRPAGRTRASRA